MVLEGEEKVKMRYETGSGDNRRTVHKKQKEEIYKQIIDIFYFADGHVPAGQFSFPFSVQVPNWLPPSFMWKYHDSDEKYKALIRYKIKAYIVDNHKKDKPIYGKRVLLVNPNPPPMAQAAEMVNKSEVKTCCCFGQGPAEIMAYFERNVYYPTETAKAFIRMDNSKCAKDIEHISMKLMRSVRITAGNTTKAKEWKMAGLRQPGMTAGKAEERTMELNLSEFAQNFGSTLKVQRKGEKQYSQEEIHLAANIQPVVMGKLIQCNYFIDVKPNYGSCDCCRNPPKVRMPMFLCNPQFQIMMTPPPQMQNWNPTTHHIVQMTYEQPANQAYQQPPAPLPVTI